MKTRLLLPFSLFITTFLHAQGPGIEWEVNIGGDDWDECRTINETPDGGFILGGFSASDVSGNKTAPSWGQYDYYIVKLDIWGNVEWERSYGGEQRDQCYKAIPTWDGGYLLGGWSESEISGNKTAPLYGERDCWIIKTNSVGDIEWQTTVGGDLNDYIFTLNQVSDGGFVFGGFSDSNLSGNKTEENIGSYDYFVFKLDVDGNIVWQNTIGGTGEEKLHAIIETNDGGFFCGGTSESTDVDHTSALIGTEDFWVLKLDAGGNILWDKSYGGFDVEELFDIYQDEEDNYILAGFTTSDSTGDVMEPIIGTQDGWAVKLDPDGNIIWSNLIGGSMGDRLECAYVMNDGNYFMGSGSFSPLSGDQAEASWDWDYWLKKLNQETGEIIWQVNLGGFGVDLPRTIMQSNDGSFAACGESTSGVGVEKNTPNYGNYDYWIIKLRCEDPLTWYADADGDGFGDAVAPTLSTCTAYPGYVLDNTDCNDLSAIAYPGAPEICNSLDDNCEGTIDEGALAIFYADADGDSYGDPLINIEACPGPAGYVLNSNDCDDADASVNPGITEICNAIDDNCDLVIDEGLTTTYYADADADGFGDIASTTEACSLPFGYAIDNSDCNDADGNVYPGATEICNTIDDNCDANIDEFVQNTYYQDADGDDFGNPGATTLGCITPAGYTSDFTDCDDTNASIYPGAPEIFNGIDDNCNEAIDEGVIAIDEEKSSEIFIYPNPVGDELIIETTLSGNIELQLHDALGRLLITNTSSENKILINVSGFDAGIYFITIKSEDAIFLNKIIKK